MRLIDADELIVMKFGNMQFVPKEFIDNALTIDAVEVVRCKDCNHYYFDKPNDCWMCHQHDYGEIYQNTDYCSWGERKDEK